MDSNQIKLFVIYKNKLQQNFKFVKLHGYISSFYQKKKEEFTLGSSAEYTTVSAIFGVGISTVCTIVKSFCEQVWRALKPTFLCAYPLNEDIIKENVNGFEKLGFPQCFGAIDGCHIEIKPPVQDAVDYYNYKGWYSTVLLAVVDYRT